MQGDINSISVYKRNPKRPNQINLYSLNEFFSKPFSHRVTKDYIEFIPVSITTKLRVCKSVKKHNGYYFSLLMPYDIEPKRYLFDEDDSINGVLRFYYNEE